MNHILKCLSFCIWSVLLNFNEIFGQDALAEKGTFMSLSVGHSQQTDYLINKLRNDGLALSLTGEHCFLTGNLYNNISLQFKANKLSNRYNMDNYLTGFGLGYNVLKEAGSFYYGAHLRYSIMNYTNEYFDSQHNYWVSHINAGLSFMFKKEINDKTYISASLLFPLAGFLSRPDQNRLFVLNEPDIKATDVIKRINSNYKFHFAVDGFIYFDTSANFHFTLANEKELVVGYNLYYEQTNVSAKSQLFNNTIVLKYQISR
jgi:hypothetical protein